MTVYTFSMSHLHRNERTPRMGRRRNKNRNPFSLKMNLRLTISVLEEMKLISLFDLDFLRSFYGWWRNSQYKSLKLLLYIWQFWYIMLSVISIYNILLYKNQIPKWNTFCSFYILNFNFSIGPLQFRLCCIFNLISRLKSAVNIYN